MSSYCKQTRLRIKIAICAYAYEFENVSLVTDDIFDKFSRKINLSKKTSNAVMDTYFEENFHPDTGIWIHNHPDLDGIKRLYLEHYKDEEDD